MAGRLARWVGRRQAGTLAVVTGASLVLLGLTASDVLASVGAPASRPAAGIMPAALSTGTEPGPAAAAADHGVVYVFWKDPSGQLWDVQSTEWTKKWGAAHKVTGMDQLGSAPAVAVIFNSSFSSADGLYVIWENARSHKLWYAFLDNSNQWNGPYPFAGSAVTTSVPAAVQVGSDLEVFWRNSNGDLEEAVCEGGSTCQGGQPQEVTAGGQVMGPMGSGPAVGLSTFGTEVFWRGTGAHHLWLAYTKFGHWHSPVLVRDTKGHLMGPVASGPAVASSALSPEPASAFNIWWQSASTKGLEETTLQVNGGPVRFDNPGHFSPQHRPKLLVTIASAPTVADGANGQYVFWKGRDRDLWFAAYHVRWHGPVKLHAGPIG